MQVAGEIGAAHSGRQVEEGTKRQDVADAADRIDLALEIETRDPWTVMSVHGEIDAYTSPQLRSKLREVIDRGSLDLLIDLEGVGFMDSTGLGVLIGALKRLRERDGRVALVVTRPPLLRILRITGLDQVFTLYESLDGAVAS